MSAITLESHGRQVIDRVTDILKEVCGGYANQLPDQKLKEMADCVVGTYRLKCQTGKIFQE